MSSSQVKEQSIVLIGKLGHGKTQLLNKVCGTTFSSVMCAESCTRTNQIATTIRYGIRVIDTPGFGSSDDTDSHIQAQRAAIEGIRISGIYLVVKYSSSGDMAECLNHLMDFVGVDDVRIIVTHADCADRSQGFDEQEIASDLSKRLDVEDRHIRLVGKDTDAPTIEDFLYQTLHKPRQFKIDSEQLAYATSLTVGARQFNNDIDQAEGKLVVAEVVLKQLLNTARDAGRRANVNLAIEATLSAVKHMVDATRDDVEKRSKELTPEQGRIVEGKIHTVLMVGLRELSEKVDRLSRQGMEPANKKKRKKRKKPSYQYGNQKPTLTGAFVREDSTSTWSIQFRWKGSKISLGDFLAREIESESLPEGNPRLKSKVLGRCCGWAKNSKQVQGCESSRTMPPGDDARTSQLSGVPAHSVPLFASDHSQSPPSIENHFAVGSWVEMTPRQELEHVDLEAQNGWPLNNRSETEPLCHENTVTLLGVEACPSKMKPIRSPSFSTNSRSPQRRTGRGAPSDPSPPAPPSAHSDSSSWIRWCCCCTLPQSICLVVATALVVCLRPSNGRHNSRPG
jgi:50S ribosome-binding GTPase